MAEWNDPNWQSRGRIEWVYTVSSIGQSTTSVQVFVSAWLRLDQYASSYGAYPFSQWSWWGTAGGTADMSIPAGGSAYVTSGTYTVNLTDSAQNINFGIGVNHFHGRTDSTLTVRVGARYAKTPTSLSVSRNSDSSHTLNWTRNSTYTAVVVQRRENSGSGWSGWSQVGRPTGNAQTYTDTTTRANRQYQYRVAGVSAGGQSGWSNTPTVYTTPAAVTAVTAQKVGLDIEVTATGLPPYATGYRIDDNGAQVATGVTSFPWLHSAPNPSETHTYTVYATRGSLVSAGTESNTVQLQAPPLAPSQLSPNGGVAPSDEDVRFSWLHNPVDTSAQTGYRLQHRAPGGSWTTLTGTTASFRDVTLPVGTFEWQVQTRGAHASFGPYSAVATVTVISRPGVAVQGAPVTDTPVYTVEWDYSQAEGRPQSAWQVELRDSDNEIIEQRSGTGATTSLTLNTRLVDGETYTVLVRAATGEVWSEWSPLELDVAFIPPAEPVVSGGWDDEAGTVELNVTAGEGDVIPDLVTIERSVQEDVWEPWITDADFTAGEAAFTDHLSLSNGVTTYRVTVIHSVTGAAASVEYIVVADSEAIWLSGGDGFGIHARLPHSPKTTITSGRSSTLHYFQGREKPVVFGGSHTHYEVDASGLTFEGYPSTTQVDALERLAQTRGSLFLYRDPDGRRIFGRVEQISLPRQMVGVWSYGFQLTETDR